MTEVVTILQPEIVRVSVAQPGLPGPPGPPGVAGGATYTHTQTLAAAVWTVAHNLLRYPSVMVVDNLGNTLAADIVYLDNTLIQITHGSALTGAVYCN